MHATPTGMAQHPGLPLPAELLRPELWVADIVYRPLETELLRRAGALGCRTMHGGGMVVSDVLGLPVEDLVDEVVDDVPVVAGEPGDERGRVVAAPQRERGELQRGDPALGAGLERGHVGGGERKAVDVVEVGGPPRLGEAQVGGADLDAARRGRAAGPAAAPGRRGC